MGTDAKIYDAVVIGAGPAGSTAALTMAREGLSVLVADRARFPRFHIGESFLPRNKALIRELGLEGPLAAIPQVPKHGAEFGMGDGSRTSLDLLRAEPRARRDRGLQHRARAVRRHAARRGTAGRRRGAGGGRGARDPAARRRRRGGGARRPARGARGRGTLAGRRQRPGHGRGQAPGHPAGAPAPQEGRLLRPLRERRQEAGHRGRLHRHRHVRRGLVLGDPARRAPDLRSVW